MDNRLIIYALIIIVVTVAIAGAIAATRIKENPTKLPSGNENRYPELATVLNKSGSYSFSYVNAHGKRIAALDEEGNAYYFICSPTGALDAIIDERNNTIWSGNRT